MHRISDHQPYFITLDYLKVKKNSHRYQKIFPNDSQTLNHFKNEIANLNLVTKINTSIETDPNDNYNLIDKHITQSVDKYLPVK